MSTVDIVQNYGISVMSCVTMELPIISMLRNSPISCFLKCWMKPVKKTP